MFARTLAALAGATLAAATPALAQPEPRSATVSFADLDLASEPGRAQLDRRIRHAAASICGPSENDSALRASYNACRTGAIADSQRQLASLTGAKSIQLAARSAR